MTAIDASIEDVRRFFAALITRRMGVTDPRIEQAFAETDRAAFLGPGPWTMLGGLSTPSDDPVFVYQDAVFFIDEEAGITNGEPALHARYMSALKIQPGETLIHVGTGAGYYTSMLASLVGPEGRVVGYEVHEPTAERAKGNLAGAPNVEVRAESGVDGPLPEADVVYVNAGSTRPAPAWLDAMKPGARLLFHLTADSNFGWSFIVRREEEQFTARLFGPVGIVPCVGARDAPGAAAIAARQGSNPGVVRSLRRDPEAADETAWLVGDGWWLSARPVGEAERQES